MINVENRSQNYLKRFLIVGLISTCINYALFIIMYVFVMMRYDWAYVIGFLSGVACGYFLNHNWTFRLTSRYRWIDIVKYLTVYGASLSLGFICFRLVVNSFDVEPVVVNLGIILFTTFINYTGIRFWVFQS